MLYTYLATSAKSRLAIADAKTASQADIFSWKLFNGEDSWRYPFDTHYDSFYRMKFYRMNEDYFQILVPNLQKNCITWFNMIFFRIWYMNKRILFLYLHQLGL